MTTALYITNSLLIIFLLIISSSCSGVKKLFSSQDICPNDTTGYVTEYLDARLNPTERANAEYSRFVYCDKGLRVPEREMRHPKSWKLSIPNSSSNSLVKLDGTVTSYYKEHVRAEEFYDNGYLDLLITYGRKSSDTLEVVDYYIPFKGNGSFAKITIFEDGTPKKSSVLRKKKDKWGMSLK